MFQYIIECIAFQLAFLIIYDFLLKRETFFQWNRFYLIGTYLLSMLLPWIKIEALKTEVSQPFTMYPEFLWTVQRPVQEIAPTNASYFLWSWQEGILYGGMLVAILVLLYKIGQLYTIRRRGKVVRHVEFTQIIVQNSNLAFSFFKFIFLGDKVIQRKHDTIIAHELVHIQQGHTWDLLFFELMRIIGWFNPLVYVYQSRMAELHEFIADAQVDKVHKCEHYQQLLSQVFQTEHISFINQFFTKSLIKKRIVMLQKTKSKKVWQLKYILLVPVLLGMLFYTSCEFEAQESSTIPSQNLSVSDETLIQELIREIEGARKIYGEGWHTKMNEKYGLFDSKNPIQTKKEYFVARLSISLYLKQLTEEYPDKLKVDLKTLSYPSSLDYENYVKREKAFQILDENLRISVSEKDMTIRLILKEDENLGPGDWITVVDVKDLTGTEVKKVNAALEMMKGTPRNVVIADQQYSFIIQNDIREPIEIGFLDNNNDDGITKKQETPSISFASIDQVPIFPGCENATDKRACFNEKIQEHISKNFNYPSEAQEAGIQGRVSVIFRISPEGIVENIKTKGPDASLENEVVRIIKRLPKMTPGKNKGILVNVPYSIPVNFKLD